MTFCLSHLFLQNLLHITVIRRRRQLVRDRVRTQSRIKAEQSFFGIHLEEPRGKWDIAEYQFWEPLDAGELQPPAGAV